MVTAVGQDSMLDECTKLGASGYIIKPFNDEKIIEAVKAALK